MSPIIPVMDPDAFLLELGLDEIKARINDAGSYLDYMRYNTNAIVDALR